MATTVDQHKLLTPAEVGEQLGISVGALAQMRYLGTGPEYVKLSARAVRYRQSDLDSWVEASLRSRTSGGAA